LEIETDWNNAEIREPLCWALPDPDIWTDRWDLTTRQVERFRGPEDFLAFAGYS
jgi:hypothetical protein